MKANWVIVAIVSIVVLALILGGLFLYGRTRKKNGSSKKDGFRTPGSNHSGPDLPSSSDITIGLWHESVPTSTWGTLNHDLFLGNTHNNDGTTTLGFKSYTELYINYATNIVKVAQKKGIKPGEFYFSVGDPIMIDPTTKEASLNGPAYYYACPPPANKKVGYPQPSERPMINEYLIQPLGEAGITKFGLALGNYNKSTDPWAWVSSKYPTNQIKAGTLINGIRVETDAVAIESLFKLVAELNDDLAAHGSKLFIQYLGFDNEGFGNIFPSQGMDPPPLKPAGAHSDWKCTQMPQGAKGVLNPDTIINYLWDYYMNMEGKKWATAERNWGKTGQTPAFYSTCATKDMKKTADAIVPGSSRNFAFIEWYNLPGDTAATKTVDHPSFAPNNPFWTADVTYFADSGYKHLLPPDKTITPTQFNKLLKYNAYYGLNTPQRKRNIMKDLSRWNPDMSDKAAKTYFDGFYSQQPEPSLEQIITGLANVPKTLTYPLTSYRDTVDPAFVKYIFDTYNQKKAPGDENGNWDTVASNYNKLSRNDPWVDVSDGTRWMLSIENFSASYGTIKQDGLKHLTDGSGPTDGPELPADQVDINAPTSSVALKFAGNGGPFTQTGKTDSPYKLLEYGQASGTFEAFGAWELDEIMDFMLYSNENVVDINKPGKKIVKNFMLYEFNFAQLRQCAADYVK